MRRARPSSSKPGLQHGKVSSNCSAAGVWEEVQACVFWRGRSMVPRGPRSVPMAQTPSSSSMSGTRSGHVVHATTKAAAGRRAGSHPKLLCFCNTKVETERQGRGSPTCSSLPVRRPASTPLRVWGCRWRQRCGPDFQRHFCCPSGNGIHYCPQ